jgi:xanthine dehydrogenase accessory factor
VDVFEEMSDLSRRGEAFALATVVWRQGPSSSQAGSRAIITLDGEVHGWIGGACAEPVVIREAVHALTEGTSRLLLLGTPEQFGQSVPEGMTVIPISCQSEGALQVYIEPVLPVPHLVIVGESPMAHTLAALAGALRWRTELIAGPDFLAATSDDEPWRDQRCMIVVATQGHDDEDVLTRAIAARPAYVGLVGSRRRGSTVLGYLAEQGVPKNQLDQVKVPAGLDLGKTTHQEIAVAILAELVQLRASGALGRRAATAGRPASQARDTSAADPVCGMAVTAEVSNRPLTHDGSTYYFCSAACKRAFAENPDAYLKRPIQIGNA